MPARGEDNVINNLEGKTIVLFTETECIEMGSLTLTWQREK